jgi:hypothetical protein
MPRHHKRFGLLDTDLEHIVRNQALVYENAGTCWQDGHILGNGDLGAVAYAPYWLEWTINKIDVFDNRSAPKKRLTYREVMAEARRRGAKDLRFLPDLEPADTRGIPREPLLKSCGEIKVRTSANEYSWGAPQPCRIRQVLSLWDATDVMEMHLPRDRYATSMDRARPQHTKVSSFVSRDSNLMVVRMRGASGALLEDKRIELCRRYDCDLTEPRFGNRGDTAWFTQAMPDGTSYAMVIGAVPVASVACRRAMLEAAVRGVEQAGDRIWLNVTGDFDLFVGVATSYETASPLRRAREIVADAIRTGAGRLEQQHARWWRRFWEKSYIQFDDHPMLEQLWYFGLYQAGSALGRAPVPGLFGLWYGHQDLPRQGFFWAVYTLDQNCQIHTLPVFCVNHPELAVPFMDTFLEALPITLEQTRAWFEQPGACFPLEMGFKGGEPDLDSDYRMSLCAGPYCGIVFVWAWRYTRDRRLLRDRIYPFLRQIVRFWVAFMAKGDDGRYHIPPTVPAEIFSLTRDAIAPLSLLKPCLELAIEAAGLFDLDAAEREQWEELLANYPAYPTSNGIIVDGTDIPLAHPSHRTFRLYPLVLAHEPDRQTRQLVRRTLDHLMPPTPCGWGWFFFMRASLMLGKRRGLLPLLYDELRHQLKPNGLFVHPSVAREECEHPHNREWSAATPENNSTVMMVVTEMLMQSDNGLIRLFPGLTGKASARFGDLRAEGAFLVSSEMTGGRVRFVTIKTEKTATAKVKNPWRRETVSLRHGDGRRSQIRGDTLSLPLKRHERVTLVPAGARALVRKTVCRRRACPKTMRFPNGDVVRLGKA